MIERLIEWAGARNITVQLEPSTGFCARVRLVDGRNHMVIGADLGLNSSSARRVADDKAFARYFLELDGLATVDTRVIGPGDPVRFDGLLPVVVKPNRGYGGDGVLAVTDARWLATAVEYARRFDDRVLVQPRIEAPEFRLIVLDGACIGVYERLGLVLEGDGQSTVRRLLGVQAPALSARLYAGEDSPIAYSLRCRNMTLNDVPKRGALIQPIVAANLKQGANHRDRSDVHPRYKRLAVDATRALGLVVSGVDLFASDITSPDGMAAIIEVNANPGFEYLQHVPASLDRLVRRACGEDRADVG